MDEDSPYKELGDIEANDLIKFAYQIATGMVSSGVKGHCGQYHLLSMWNIKVQRT